MSKKEQEVKLHQDIVNDYDQRHKHEFSNYYHAYWNNKLIALSKKDKKVNVLDLGCGTGALIKDLAKRYDNVYGVDISPDMISRIDRGDKHIIDLVVAPAEALPFDDDFFDVVYCRGALHHFEDLDKGCLEIARILKADGELIISEPNADSLVLRIPRKMFNKHHDHFHENHRSLESKEVIDLFVKNNFELNVLLRFGFLAFPFGGLSDLIPMIDRVPFKKILIKALIRIDEILSKVYFINRQSWHMIVKFNKK